MILDHWNYSSLEFKHDVENAYQVFRVGIFIRDFKQVEAREFWRLRLEIVVPDDPTYSNLVSSQVARLQLTSFMHMMMMMMIDSLSLW
jgi:hypothetical protein